MRAIQRWKAPREGLSSLLAVGEQRQDEICWGCHRGSSIPSLMPSMRLSRHQRMGGGRSGLYMFSGLAKIAECIHLSIFPCPPFCLGDKGSTIYCALKSCPGLCGRRCYESAIFLEDMSARQQINRALDKYVG